MTLPQNTDYQEAIQNPQSCFQDSELRQCRPELDTIGLPRARSGNFADVYQLQAVPGKAWAVKCFTREAQDLQQRYHAIFHHLQEARLAFTVPFQYLAQGIRVKGQWYPIVKMSWVEGLTLNEFIKEQVDKAPLLRALADMWIKLARQLREAGVAHGDLQHGNVLLISGNKAGSMHLRLIDYDGMFVPALAQTSSGEVGHPNYQHPQRLRDGTYNAQVDRFAHLVIHCALRCLAVGGGQLWERYDNLDNLLFREKDFQTPGTSPLFQELWQLRDPVVRALVGNLILASLMPVEQVPLLEDLAGPGQRLALTPAQEHQVQALLNTGAGQLRPVPHFTETPTPTVQAGAALPLAPAAALPGAAAGVWGPVANPFFPAPAGAPARQTGPMGMQLPVQRAGAAPAATKGPAKKCTGCGLWLAWHHTTCPQCGYTDWTGVSGVGVLSFVSFLAGSVLGIPLLFLGGAYLVIAVVWLVRALRVPRLGIARAQTVGPWVAGSVAGASFLLVLIVVAVRVGSSLSYSKVVDKNKSARTAGDDFGAGKKKNDFAPGDKKDDFGFDDKKDDFGAGKGWADGDKTGSIHGTWKATGIAVGGGKENPALNGDIVTFGANGKATADHGGKKSEGRYKVDASKQPAQIDLTWKQDGKDDLKLGIYTLTGDTLRITFNVRADEPRPTLFNGKDTYTWVLKRTSK